VRVEIGHKPGVFRGTGGSNPVPSSGESDELPPEQARSPSDLEVVLYWDLAATERTKLNDRTRQSAPSSAAIRTVANPRGGFRGDDRNYLEYGLKVDDNLKW